MPFPPPPDLQVLIFDIGATTTRWCQQNLGVFYTCHIPWTKLPGDTDRQTCVSIASCYEPESVLWTVWTYWRCWRYAWRVSPAAVFCMRYFVAEWLVSPNFDCYVLLHACCWPHFPSPSTSGIGSIPHAISPDESKGESLLHSHRSHLGRVKENFCHTAIYLT